MPYAYRDALDLRFDRRVKIVKEKDPETGEVKKKNKVYYVWTQGPIINFKDGDTITSNKGHPTLQVQSANPMEWDEANNIMNQGIVTYAIFEDVKFGVIDIPTKKVTQMEFLEIITTGE